MKAMNLDQVVRKLDRRLERVEQILPTLPTREEVDQALDRITRLEDARVQAGGGC